MGSSWRYRHVTITPYYIGGFHGLNHMFFTSSLVLFHGLKFRFDEQARDFTRRWKTTGLHQNKQKNQSAQSAGQTFSQHFPTQVSPHYIQLDPIYYGQTTIQKRIVSAETIWGNTIFAFKASAWCIDRGIKDCTETASFAENLLKGKVSDIFSRMPHCRKVKIFTIKWNKSLERHFYSAWYYHLHIF